jgi:hypothetical protein
MDTNMRIDELRLFYNHTIQPELLRLEFKRKRLLRLLVWSGVALVAIFIIALAINILPLTLMLCIPIVIYIGYLLNQIRQFQLRFKPHVIRLILDFLDNDVHYGTLQYDPEKEISRGHFENSSLFVNDAIEFDGEDYIYGRVGEMEFELCELEVNEMSKVRNRVDKVFRGVFLHSQFQKEMNGSILIIPREMRQYAMRSIKQFTRRNASAIHVQQAHDLGFDDCFLTYATPDANVSNLLSSEMQDAIMRYQDLTQSLVYVSFIGSDIYVAVDQPEDMLEPFLIQSNVSFDLVLEYYQKIELLLSIIRDFDLNN